MGETKWRWPSVLCQVLDLVVQRLRCCGGQGGENSDRLVLEQKGVKGFRFFRVPVRRGAKLGFGDKQVLGCTPVRLLLYDCVGCGYWCTAGGGDGFAE